MTANKSPLVAAVAPADGNKTAMQKQYECGLAAARQQTAS